MFTILAISDSDKHFTTALQEYRKRLWRQLIIDDLKPFRDENQFLVIEKETDKLIDQLYKKYSHHQKLLLIKEGEQLDTIAFSQVLQGKETVFIIGGPYGVDDQRLKSEFPSLKMLSFWAITLPHGLAKLTLVEQLYRATTLWSGKKYHY